LRTRQEIGRVAGKIDPGIRAQEFVAIDAGFFVAHDEVFWSVGMGDDQAVVRIEKGAMRAEAGITNPPGRSIQADMAQCQFTDDLIRQ